MAKLPSNPHLFFINSSSNTPPTYEELQQHNVKLINALCFYALQSNYEQRREFDGMDGYRYYPSPVEQDNGEKARKALENE